MAKYKQERWGVTVFDSQAWEREQRFVVQDGKAVCNICRQAPRFFGWGNGAATYSCGCGVDQDTFERRKYE